MKVSTTMGFDAVLVRKFLFVENENDRLFGRFLCIIDCTIFVDIVVVNIDL